MKPDGSAQEAAPTHRYPHLCLPIYVPEHAKMHLHACRGMMRGAMREKLPDLAAKAGMSVSEYARLMDHDDDMGYE